MIASLIKERGYVSFQGESQFLTPAHHCIHDCIWEWHPVLDLKVGYSLEYKYSVNRGATNTAWYIPCVRRSIGGASSRTMGGKVIWVVGWVCGKILYWCEMVTAQSWGRMMEFFSCSEWVWDRDNPCVIAKKCWNVLFLGNVEVVMVGNFQMDTSWEIWIEVWSFIWLDPSWGIRQKFCLKIVRNYPARTIRRSFGRQMGIWGDRWSRRRGSWWKCEMGVSCNQEMELCLEVKKQRLSTHADQDPVLHK